MSETFTLHYWPTIPGRGEYIRLAFEASGVACTDKSDDAGTLVKHLGPQGDAGHPPHFAPPILEVSIQRPTSGGKARKTAEGQDAKEAAAASSAASTATTSSSFFLSQTPVILAYLAPKLGLDGTKDESLDEVETEIRRARVAQLTATALDVNNEVHDVHHPIAPGLYYEDQKEEAARRAQDFRTNRVPKFFNVFEAAIATNPAKSGFLIGKTVTTADLVLFQVVEGLSFAFPNLVKRLREGKEYEGIFALRDQVASLDTIKTYLASERRRPFSNGIFRHYAELDP